MDSGIRFKTQRPGAAEPQPNGRVGTERPIAGFDVSVLNAEMHRTRREGKKTAEGAEKSERAAEEPTTIR